MEILFFTEKEKAYYINLFAGHVFTGPYWKFIKTPKGWILPAIIMKDEKILAIIPDNVKVKEDIERNKHSEITKREYSPSDKLNTDINELLRK